MEQILLKDVEQRTAAKKFAKDWEGKGYEKGDTQSFWISLLRDIFGVIKPEQIIKFEGQVKLAHTSFIDGYIESTRVLIEQKSLGKDLRAPIKQSDGTFLTPYQQAKRYASELSYSARPRWIVTCNFESFLVYDMECPDEEPQEILLRDLGKDYYRLSFLVNPNVRIQKEMEVSIKAGALIGKIYDALLKQYNDPTSEKALKSLNVLCVRLVFCLYAEDAGVFGERNMFLNYLNEFDARKLRGALIELFKVLDTEEDKRDPYLDDALAAFPYVNGGLFADDSIEIPQFTDEVRGLLLDKASADFNWSLISPTIFGALFESTLNPEIRRSGGMHYTSVENIHKVIDPLFLNDLINEFENIKEMKVKRNRKSALLKYQDKLASLKFLDPACGCGNFLTETYICLRNLENKVLREFYAGEIVLGEITNPIKVSIQQFYGIEINDFAVTVAKTALWIAESQMMKATEDVVHKSLDFLPLKSYISIVEANALRIDWETVIPKAKLNYIISNPPFVGFTYMQPMQKEDMNIIFPGTKNLDYVCAWYKKASDLIENTLIKCAFVSTNSITQGETVARLWEHININISFAYTTFVWDSEANQKAHVHCVIIGFVSYRPSEHWLFTNSISKKVNNINAYLKDAPNTIVKSRNTPLSKVSKMVYGNKPADGSNLIIEDCDYEEFIAREPASKEYIKPLLGAKEYLHNKRRWCLWLVGISPQKLKSMPLVCKRVEGCQRTRLESKAKEIRKFAATPTLFAQITQPENQEYIIVPRVSSEHREYIPMGFMGAETKVTDAVQIIPNASLYEFGVLMSNVHMHWMRAVAGRLEMRYRYSKDIVYNNFPWPTPTDGQRVKIEKTAQGILDARALYADSSLADLYDNKVMPNELRKAHQANDRAVMEAYGFWGKLNDESDCVAVLMEMYQKLVE